MSSRFILFKVIFVGTFICESYFYVAIHIGSGSLFFKWIKAFELRRTFDGLYMRTWGTLWRYQSFNNIIIPAQCWAQASYHAGPVRFGNFTHDLTASQAVQISSRRFIKRNKSSW